MKQPNRIKGGLIERRGGLGFTWNGRAMTGHRGDTLASALLANGVGLVGRSFKYHRPRGIFSAGSEEPNALVELGTGAAREPNTKATTIELFDGLVASSQNHRGPLGFDVMAVNDYLSPFLSAGFYYKTFMWPRSFWEKVYEPIIRSSAGLGRLSGLPDPDIYDKGFLHCDVLVIGAGPAGLTAALACGRLGCRVILADEDFRMGGRLNAETHQLDGRAGADWAAQAVDELAAMKNVRLMPRTTVYGAFDHGVYGAIEHMAHRKGAAPGALPRQVNWRIYTRRAILAAGATERSMAFANNDRPGIMLAGAARAYVNRFAVAPGRRVAVYTNNDDGLRTAGDLRARGVDVVEVIDARSGARVVDTSGRLGLRAIRLGDGRRLEVDCLAVSGGWSPNVALTCHHRGRPKWNERLAAFVPSGDLPPGMSIAGAAGGTMTLAAAVTKAHATAVSLAGEIGVLRAALRGAGKPALGDDEASGVDAIFETGRGTRGPRAWVDLQNDVTTKDIEQAHKEGFGAIEHMKRYTTLGMATDQGRTSGVLGIAVMARASGRTIAETGTTIFRPPYAPVAIGAFAARSRGGDFRPRRLTPSHGWASENGADFVETGMWLRAQWFRRPGEKGWRDSVDREVEMTRGGVGICDVTTLGKIDIQGRDAAAFLNRVYSNPFAKLATGRVRYGLMLREDGIVYDDGTCARLADDHYVMTTTTANAVLVFRNLEFARQCLWPELDVHLVSTTDGWAQFAVAGPKSRELLQGVVDGLDLSNEAFGFMACANCTVFGGTPARLFRISFSGELAYEIAVPARYGDSMIRALMKVGGPLGVVPYGTEALGVMRVEKGHAAGAELNGQTTALMLGLGGMVSAKKDAIGTRLSMRDEMTRKDGLRLVGFRPVDRRRILAAGAHFLNPGEPADMAHDQGWMTSVAWSPELGHSVGLGFLKRGKARMGEVVRAYNPVRNQDIEVEVCSPHHIDPEGVRQNG